MELNTSTDFIKKKYFCHKIIISFGILGHVFTIDKADIKERVKQ